MQRNNRKGKVKVASFETHESRFWRYVEKVNECWIWRGSIAKNGYPRFSLSPNVEVAAHRLSWEMHNGVAFPSGLFACHHCDNRACVNPNHLFAGTVADNQLDMARKWRTRSKLSHEQVCEIRESAEPYRVLAARYGLKSHKSITNIKRGATFAHAA